MSNNREIRDKIAQNDVTVMRSYLEVDFAEWLSDNEIPFGYEAFTIPSIYGPSKSEWDMMVEGIKAVGRDDFDEYDRVTEGTRWEDKRPAEILSIWTDIYDKHRLQDETITVPVKESLEGFDKKLMLPDFSIYKDAGIKTAGEGFDWGSFDALVEVSGLWGVGLPEESSKSDWWKWYRVSAVAFKELAYRLLGLWDKVYWVLPNQGYDETTGDGIPRPIREDDHYILMNTTQTDLKLDELEDKLGVTAGSINAGLSPPIRPAKYHRPSQSPSDYEVGDISQQKFSFDSINMDNINRNERAVRLEDDWLVYHGDLGEVYIHSAHAHVRESMWRKFNMILLREYVLDTLRELGDSGIVQGLAPGEK